MLSPIVLEYKVNAMSYFSIQDTPLVQLIFRFVGAEKHLITFQRINRILQKGTPGIKVNAEFVEKCLTKE